MPNDFEYLPDDNLIRLILDIFLASEIQQVDKTKIIDLTTELAKRYGNRLRKRKVLLGDLLNYLYENKNSAYIEDKSFFEKILNRIKETIFRNESHIINYNDQNEKKNPVIEFYKNEISLFVFNKFINSLNNKRLLIKLNNSNDQKIKNSAIKFFNILKSDFISFSIYLRKYSDYFSDFDLDFELDLIRAGKKTTNYFIFLTKLRDEYEKYIEYHHKIEVNFEVENSLKKIKHSYSTELLNAHLEFHQKLNDILLSQNSLERKKQEIDQLKEEYKEKIGFGQITKKSSGDTSFQNLKNSSENSIIDENVKSNTTNDEEYVFIIDPITKKPVKKKVQKELKPITPEEIEKQLETLQRYTVILPESDYFINSTNPRRVSKFPEYFVIDGTEGYQAFIECQKYWKMKLRELYSNPFKKGPVEEPKPIKAEIATKDVTKLAIYTVAAGFILKKLKFKNKTKTVQKKIMQKNSRKLGRMKLKPSNHKKLSNTKNLFQSKVKNKTTKGGLSFNGKNISQRNSRVMPKLNSVGKGNRGKIMPRLSGKPPVGRYPGWVQGKHNSQFGASGVQLMNNGAGGAGKPEIFSK